MPSDRNVDILALERTLLAAERTFSAWIRTGLAGVGGGLAIAHAIVFKNPTNQTIAQWIGVLLVVWGGGVFVFALADYRRTRARLSREAHMPKGSPFLLPITAILVLVAALVLWIIV